MKITCATTFMDGQDRFEAGDVRTVSDERGAYFVANGWATTNGQAIGTVAPGDASLAIANGNHGQESRHG